MVNSEHSVYFLEALARIDSVYVPSKEDWHDAVENWHKANKELGVTLKWQYPFPEEYLREGYNDIYDYIYSIS